MAVNILGAFNGPLLATSQPVTLPSSFAGAVVFQFAKVVGLIPGQSYVLQPISVAGSPDWAVDANSGFVDQPDYPSGRLLFEGQFFDRDLIFREGIGVPEPATLVLFALAAALISVSPVMRKGPARQVNDSNERLASEKHEH